MQQRRVPTLCWRILRHNVRSGYSAGDVQAVKNSTDRWLFLALQICISIAIFSSFMARHYEHQRVRELEQRIQALTSNGNHVEIQSQAP